MRFEPVVVVGLGLVAVLLLVVATYPGLPVLPVCGLLVLLAFHLVFAGKGRAMIVLVVGVVAVAVAVVVVVVVVVLVVVDQE